MACKANTNILKTSTGGSQFVNFTNGTIRITVLGEKMKSETLASNAGADGTLVPFKIEFDGTTAQEGHKMAIYSAELTVPDTGISIPLDNIMGRTRNINDIFDGGGSFAGTTKGNEILNTTDMSIGFTEDYVYLSDKASGHIISRDIIRAMMLAETFPHNGETIKVAGTNGTVKRGEKATSNRYFGGLFIKDGKLVVPQSTDEFGNPILKTNARVAAYNTTALTVMIEFLYTFSQEKKSGFRFVYVLNGGVTYNEADDANKVSATAQILCDPRAIDSFFISGGADIDAYANIKADDTMATPTGTVKAMTLGRAGMAAKTDNPILMYVNVDHAPVEPSLPLGTKRRRMSTRNTAGMITSGYMLFDSLGNPVPAYVGIKGENPKVVELATITDNKAIDYVFDIYDYDMKESQFVPYYFPAQENYVTPTSIVSQPIKAVEPKVDTTTFKI